MPMHKVLYIAIGVTLFILIVGCAFMEFGDKSNNDEVNFSEINDLETGKVVYKGKFLMPVENFIVVTSEFGKREGGGVVSTNHKGIDLVGKKNSNVMCVQDGIVTWAGWQNGYGNCVEVKHIDEKGNTFYTFYAHMQNNSIRVKKNQKIVEGQVVGKQGSTRKFNR